MNYKEYNEIKKHITLEHEMEEQEKILDAFKRVMEGKKFSLGDLQIVNQKLSEQSKGNYHSRELNMEDTIIFLEHEGNIMRENINKSKQRLKKRGLDLERLRRQRRLQHEKKLLEEREREREIG